MQKKHQILLWMSLSMIISYLPWYNFSAVLTYISHDFHLTPVDTGHIIAAFQAGYVIVVIATGWLADRVGLKKILITATLLTALSSTAFVFVAQDKLSVLLMRLFTGCAAGAIYVPGMALLANWFPPNERGSAMGAYTGALTAAAAGGYFIAGPLAAAYGWQIGMFWTSLPAFLAVLVLYLFVQERPAERIQFDGPPPVSGSYAGPLVITGSYMGHMWELYAFWAWIGPFMVAAAATQGLPMDDAVRWGCFMAACITVAGAPAVWLMGTVADRLGRTRTIMICATCSLVAELFFGFLLGQSLAIIVACGLWIGFWSVADSAVFKAGLTDMVRLNQRGTLLGIQSALGFFVTIVSPVVFGFILQAYNGGVDPTRAIHWGPAFLVLGLGALAAPVLAFVLRRLPQSRLMAGGKR